MSRVPTDMPLEDWIRQLIKENRLYMFYKTQDWKDLAQEVKDDHSPDCPVCEEQGRRSNVETVHHEYEVKKYPHLALTRYLVHADGTREEILKPLCMNCHNEAHGRKLNGSKPKKIPINDERW